MNVRNERREIAKMAELETQAKANIAGEELDRCSQQLFHGWRDNMSRMSFDESTEPLRGR